MEASDAWKVRWDASTLPMAKTFMQVACRKQSLVCLAADRYTMAELFDLLEAVGSSIAALKTHVDLIDDWDQTEWARFCALAQEMDLLIFEDRKFADIGKISRKQMGGIYNIQQWSDLVTAHLISGYGYCRRFASSVEGFVERRWRLAPRPNVKSRKSPQPELHLHSG